MSDQLLLAPPSRSGGHNRSSRSKDAGAVTRTMKILQIVSTIASLASLFMSMTSLIISAREASRCSSFSQELNDIEVIVLSIQEQLQTLCCNPCV